MEAETPPKSGGKGKRRNRKRDKIIGRGVKKQYRKICSAEGCTKIAQKGGACIPHGVNTQRKICIIENCTSIAQRGGLCHRHGGKKRIIRCKSCGCTNRSVKGEVCQRHGARVKVKYCTIEGCANHRVKGGVCKRHGATAPNAAPSTGRGDSAVITTAIEDARNKNGGDRAEGSSMRMWV